MALHALAGSQPKITMGVTVTVINPVTAKELSIALGYSVKVGDTVEIPVNYQVSLTDLISAPSVGQLEIE